MDAVSLSRIVAAEVVESLFPELVDALGAAMTRHQGDVAALLDQYFVEHIDSADLDGVWNWLEKIGKRRLRAKIPDLAAALPAQAQPLITKLLAALED